jgi:hypothetical protein
MFTAPKLSVERDGLLIRTENSKENSALLIYEIRPTIDQTNKVILLKGFHAPGKELQTDFRVKLEDIDLNELSNYKIYWVDPDDKRTELRIETR